MVYAEWDLGSFLSNATSSIQTWGGLLLMLLGTAALIWGGVKLIQRLLTPKKGDGPPVNAWHIALLILFGGALATGGYQLMDAVGSGGEQTVLELGGGLVMMGLLY